MRYQVVKSPVYVLGEIWMPTGVPCAMQYDLTSYDVENARDEDGEITRESVEDWLSKNAGDFSRIIDFAANIADGDKDIIIEWADEGNEAVYNDCVYGDPDDYMSCEAGDGSE